MEGDTKWPIVAARAVRVLVLMLAVVLGAALDAGLLDRRIAEAVCGVLREGAPGRQSELLSNSSPRIASRLLP